MEQAQEPRTGPKDGRTQYYSIPQPDQGFVESPDWSAFSGRNWFCLQCARSLVAQHRFLKGNAANAEYESRIGYLFPLYCA